MFTTYARREADISSSRQAQTNYTITSFEETKNINCLTLYSLAKHKLDTSKVSVYVQGCTSDGFIVGPRIYVPPADHSLYTYCPKFIGFYKVIVSYTDEKLMHQDLMTRGDFVMELLNIWETMRAKLSPNFKMMNAELDIVIAYTKAVYLTEELGDITYLEKQDSLTTDIIE